MLITVHVLFLGPAANLAETTSVSLELEPPATLRAVMDRLAAQYPKLAPALPTVRFAINQEFATENAEVRDGCEVAVIPPVSGGSGQLDALVQLVDGPIPFDEVRRFVCGGSTFGAITTFEGATREDEHDRHGRIVRLDYEAYRDMALQQMERLAADALQRWSLGRVALVHRLGSVPPAEASVMIAVASAHRDEGFTACRWLIDTLKKDVPIWKKDVYEDGTVQWVSPGLAVDAACSIRNEAPTGDE